MLRRLLLLLNIARDFYVRSGVTMGADGEQQQAKGCKSASPKYITRQS